jgi:predicted ATPase
MLTRLQVSGFKNLLDVDVRFGPFTCIAGVNGVGKSNLFDAIRFLSALADKPLIEAALMIRDPDGRTTDAKSLFHRVGERSDDTMSFEVEMIVPSEGVDDFGQKAEATITSLRYSLKLAYRPKDHRDAGSELELLKEELTHIPIGDARKHFVFEHASEWRRSAVRGARRARYFISTDENHRTIKLHQDGGSSGKPFSRSSTNLPRTVLSAANAAESPTVLLARREMQSWRLLQLEPSAIRQPDRFTASPHLSSDGSHLAATLFRLAHTNGTPRDTVSVYAEIANRLAELIDDVHAVRVDRDEKRELLTVQVADEAGTWHSARALSDGTLRFLALAAVEMDSQFRGLMCLEEPENGIHPERIPAILRLLADIAVDVNQEVGETNPLRQVIINTHSPVVVSHVPEDSLLYADLEETVQERQRFKKLAFACLAQTWRTATSNGDRVPRIISKGKLLAYLNPTTTLDEESSNTRPRQKRVIDRPDFQPLLPYAQGA